MRFVGLLVVGAAALTMTVASPATAADTTTTFTVTGGLLTIAVPASANIGSGPPATTITGSLGAVTVTDLRGANPAQWTATVSSTVITPASGTTTIPASAVTYTPGDPTATTGDGVFTPGTAGPLSGVPFTAFSHSAGTGSNNATWNPTLAIAVPDTATATTYSGTVSHLVA
jgi:hypothetical protein